MNSRIVSNVLVLAALVALGGCASNGGAALPEPLVSASGFESMIKVTVTPIVPEPVEEMPLAAVEQDHTRLQVP